MGATTYPVTLDTYGTVPDLGDHAPFTKLIGGMQQVQTRLGMVKATASVYVTGITTAIAAATAGAANQPKLYVSAGTVRVINSVTATSGTAAVKIMTTGATHGQEFELIRSAATGAAAIDVRSGTTSLHTFTASKKFACRLRFIGTGWVISSAWQGP